MKTNQTPSGVEEKIKEAHDRFHGRQTTHEKLARLSKWPVRELENVLYEDFMLFVDEITALIEQAKLEGRKIQAEATLEKWQSFPDNSHLTMFLEGQIESHTHELSQLITNRNTSIKVK